MRPESGFKASVINNGFTEQKCYLFFVTLIPSPHTPTQPKHKDTMEGAVLLSFQLSNRENLAVIRWQNPAGDGDI